MQDPNQSSSAYTSNPPPPLMWPSHHRRAHSEVRFRFPDDLDLGGSSDPFGRNCSFVEEIGSEDDLFSTYMDIGKLRAINGSDNVALENDIMTLSEDDKSAASANGTSGRPRHKHSNSMDSYSGFSFGCNNNDNSDNNDGGAIEPKKAMPPEKLAELWNLDPKRAKRILANRQSAARSKERKARYTSELERKVQSLQTEATTLSAQLTMFQVAIDRDTAGLSNENTELKLRLQAMEQQAQLRDVLNEALKQEVERLRMATGEIIDTFNVVAMQQVPTFFDPRNHQIQSGHKDLHVDVSVQNQFHHPIMANPPKDPTPIGRFQGLDISSPNTTAVVKSEGCC